MSVRITSMMLVGAIRRKVEAVGGHAMVLSKGDETSGAVILALAERSEIHRMMERGLAPDGSYQWVQTGPDAGSEASAFDAYLAKRRNFDPDIWVVEIDGVVGEEWLADFIGAD